MKTLDVIQMENVNGGDLDAGCVLASISLVAAFAGLCFVTGGAAAIWAGISFSVAPAGWGLACF